MDGGELVEGARICQRLLEPPTKEPIAPLCREVLGEVERPSFSFEIERTPEGLGRTLRVAHSGFSTLHLRAYALDPDSAAVSPRDVDVPKLIEDVLDRTDPAAEWTVALPETPELAILRTPLFLPTMAGRALLVGSLRPDFARADNRLVGVVLRIDEYVRWSLGGVELIRNALDGRDPYRSVDVSGRWPLSPVDSRAVWIPDERALSTDRAVYRRGQTLHFKLVDSRSVYGRVRLTLQDAAGDVAASRFVTLDPTFASVAGTFRLPRRGHPGIWSLTTEVSGVEPLQARFLVDRRRLRRPSPGPLPRTVVLEDVPGFLEAGVPTRLTARLRDARNDPSLGRAAWRLLRMTPLPGLQKTDEAVPLSSWGGAPGPVSTTEDPVADVLANLPDGETIAYSTAVHAADGRATVDLPPLSPGFYRLRYSAEGAPDLARELVVIDPEARGSALSLGLPAVLRAERPVVEVGETARFLVATGFQKQGMDLLVDLGGIPRYLETGDSSIIELEVEPRHETGIQATLLLARDGRTHHLSTLVAVPRRPLTLQVSRADGLAKDRRQLWTVRVLGPDGRPLAAGEAEVLVTVYDRGLDRIRAFELPDPLTPTTVVSEAHDGWHARIPGGSVPSKVWVHDGRPAPASPLAERIRDARESDLAGEKIVYRTYAPRPDVPPSRRSRSDGFRFEPETPPPESASPRTLLYEPRLVVDDRGEVTFAVELPDDGAEWAVWIQVIAPSIHRAGTLRTTLRSSDD